MTPLEGKKWKIPLGQVVEHSRYVHAQTIIQPRGFGGFLARPVGRMYDIFIRHVRGRSFTAAATTLTTGRDEYHRTRRRSFFFCFTLNFPSFFSPRSPGPHPSHASVGREPSARLYSCRDDLDQMLHVFDPRDFEKISPSAFSVRHRPYSEQ